MIRHKRYDSSISDMFKPGYAVTRGNGFQLAELSSNQDINKYCYHNRVVDIWNSLPFDIVSSQSINYVLLKAGCVLLVLTSF